MRAEAPRASRQDDLSARVAAGRCCMDSSTDQHSSREPTSAHKRSAVATGQTPRGGTRSARSSRSPRSASGTDDASQHARWRSPCALSSAQPQPAPTPRAATDSRGWSDEASATVVVVVAGPVQRAGRTLLAVSGAPLDVAAGTVPLGEAPPFITPGAFCRLVSHAQQSESTDATPDITLHKGIRTGPGYFARASRLNRKFQPSLRIQPKTALFGPWNQRVNRGLYNLRAMADCRPWPPTVSRL